MRHCASSVTRGVIVIELSEQAAVSRAPWFTPRLTRAQLLQALHELTTLITSGVTLSEGIDALIEGGHHPQIEQAFRTMGRALQQGGEFFRSPCPEQATAARLPVSSGEGG